MNNIKDILILIFVLLFAWKSCENNTPQNSVTTTIKETIKIDTIQNHIPIYVPKYTERIIIDTIWRNQKIDTSKILEDYFALYIYNDTIKKDSISIIINDSITQNKILSRNIDYTFLYTTKIIEIEKTQILNKNEFYSGVSAGFDLNKNLNNIGGELLYRTKKSQAYGLGIGFNPQNNQPNISGKIYFKIK
jgi:hypothetical protein